MTAEAAALRVRVRELERALGDAGVGVPVTSDNVFGRTDECWWLANAIGSLAIVDEGEGRDVAHVDTKPEEVIKAAPDPLLRLATWDATVPPQIFELTRTFPFGPCGTRPSVDIFRPFMPSLEEALALTRAFYDGAALFFNPVPETVFMSEIIEPIYLSGAAPDPALVHPHRLSTMFTVISLGAYYRPDDPMRFQRLHVYRMMARGAFSLDGVFNGASAATVQALLMFIASMASMLIILDDENKDETTLLLGICTRLAIAGGLHRDCCSTQFTIDEIQNRRWAFWELCNYENINSMVIGVQPTLLDQWMDVPFPDDLNPYLTVEGEVEMGFNAWKHHFTRDCDALALRFMFSKDLPPYAELQRASDVVEHYPAPSHLCFPYGNLERITDPVFPDDVTMTTDVWEAQNLIWVAGHHASACGYLHRRYFIEALRGDIADPMEHEYGDSIRAIYNSSRRTIYTISCMLHFHGVLAHKRWKYFASYYFGAVTSMAMIILEKPRTSLVPDLVRWLEYAIPVFVRATASSEYRFLDTVAVVMSRLLGQVRRRVREPGAPSRGARGSAKGTTRSASRSRRGRLAGGASTTGSLGGRPHRKIVPRRPTYGCLGDEEVQMYAALELELELGRAMGAPDTGGQGGSKKSPVGSDESAQSSAGEVPDNSMLDIWMDAMASGVQENGSVSSDCSSQTRMFGAYTTGTHWMEQLNGW